MKPGVKGRSKIDDVVMVAVARFSWFVGVRHGRVPVKLFGAIVRVIA